MKILALTLVAFIIFSTTSSSSAPIKDSGNVGAACDPKQLQPCLAAITGGGQPSGDCCAKLKGQQPCLCGFAKIPALAQYVNSPNARKVLQACGVPIPAC